MIKSVGLLYAHLNVWYFSLVNLSQALQFHMLGLMQIYCLNLFILIPLKILHAGLISGCNSGFDIFNLILVLETSFLSYFFLSAASKLAFPLSSYI